METIEIIKRRLTESEIAQISMDIVSFPDLAFVKPTLLRTFEEIYVAEIDHKFAGFCAIESYKGVRKLGPIAVSKQSQKQGAGIALMKKVLEVSRGKRTYFGTSNQRIKGYIQDIKVTEYKNIWSLPQDVRSAVIHYFFEYFSVKYILEAARKLLKFGRAPYTYFLLHE